MYERAPWWARGKAYAWLPALLIVAAAGLDEVAPERVTLTPLYVTAPLLAATLLPLLATIGYGALATAVVAAEMTWRSHPSASEATLKIGTVATAALLAVAVNRIVAARDKRVATARQISEAVQRAVVPLPPERAGELEIGARYTAADRTALVGGDLYACRETPFGVRLLVGDVRGKGLAATEAVAVLLGAFREAAECEARLESVSERLETALVRERGVRATLDPVEGFTTAVLAEIPPSADRIRMINRGHPPPVLIGPGGATDYLAAGDALPLGLGELAPRPDQVRTTSFPAGAFLLLYTDGVSEARDAAGRFYDPSKRLRGRSFAGPAALLDHVVADVGAHVKGGLQDDMALLAVHHPRDSPAPRGSGVDTKLSH